MRKLLIATVLLSLLIVGLYIALPAIAEYSVRQALAEQQINASFDLRRPGLNRIEINQLRLEKNTPEESFSMTADTISLSFNPWQLFDTHRVESVSIDALRLDLQIADASQDSTDSAPLPLPPLPSSLFSLLPADSVNLPDYTVAISRKGDTTPLPVLAFTGSITLNNEQLNVTIDQIENAADIRLAMLINSQDKGELTLFTKDTPAIVTTFSLATRDNQFNLHNDTQLYPEQLPILLRQPLIAGLTELPQPATITPLSGSISFSGNSSAPLASGLNGMVHRYEVRSQISLRPALPASTQSAIHQLNLQQNATVTLDKDLLSLTLNNLSASGKQLQINPDQTNATHISTTGVQVDLLKPLQLKSSLQQLRQTGLHALQLPTTELSIRLAPVSIKAPGLADIVVTPAPFYLTLSDISLTDRSMIADLINDNLVTLYDGKRLPQLRLNNRASISLDTIVNRFTLGVTDPLLTSDIGISGSTTTDLNNSRTTGHWKTAIPLNGIEKLLRHIDPNIPPELILTAGSLQQQGWLDLNNSGIALRMLNRAEKVDLSYDQTHLYEIDWNSETVKNHQGKLDDTGSVKVAFIDVGVPLLNLSSSYHFKQTVPGAASVQLDSSTVDLLGGTVTTLPMTIALDNPDINTAIAVTGIDLEKLIALEQQEGLSGSGTLNGQMPVQFSQGELTIVGGQIVSTPAGGWIKFDPPPAFMALTETNQALGVAFDALRNMHYEQLGIELDYQPDGEALLKTHLKGHNPTWNRGQPIDFTINIEENIPKLLQALQFTDKLTKTLEKRYR